MAIFGGAGPGPAMGFTQATQGLLASPLFSLGAGLLAASERGQGVGQGLLLGAQQYGAQQALADRSQDRELRRKLLQFQMQQAQVQQQRAVQRQQALDALTAQNPQIAGILAADPSAGIGILADQMRPQKPTTLAQNLASAGLQPGTPEYQAAMLKATMPRPAASITNIVGQGGPKLPANYMWANPQDPAAANFAVRPIPQGPADELSQAQQTAAGFAGRMESAESVLSSLEAQPDYSPADLGDYLAGGVPLLGNYATSERGQQYRQAQGDWVRAKLRKESGAAIGKDEFEGEVQTYFPQPGDSPAVIEQKRQARLREIESMRAAGQRALGSPSQFAPATPQAAKPQPMGGTPPGVPVQRPDGLWERDGILFRQLPDGSMEVVN